MVIKNINQEKGVLFEYQKKGFGKVGYYTYRFIVKDDYHAFIQMIQEREADRSMFSTKEESLSDSERMIFDCFIENNLEGKKCDLNSIFTDDVEKYEDTVIKYKDIIVSEEEGIFQDFEKFQNLVQLNHDSLSKTKVSHMFHELENIDRKIYQKNR
ncbi:MAG: hypothetical protein IKE70_05020 [Bacilli bacterium]|nr:hypothetical protein [Bacilli bacterium]